MRAELNHWYTRTALSACAYRNLWEVDANVYGTWDITYNGSYTMIVRSNEFDVATRIAREHNRDVLNMLDLFSVKGELIEKFKDCNVSDILSTSIGEYLRTHLWYFGKSVGFRSLVVNDLSDVVATDDPFCIRLSSVIGSHNDALLEMLVAGIGREDDRSFRRALGDAIYAKGVYGCMRR